MNWPIKPIWDKRVNCLWSNDGTACMVSGGLEAWERISRDEGFFKDPHTNELWPFGRYTYWRWGELAVPLGESPAGA